MRLRMRTAGLTAGASCLALMLGGGSAFAGIDEARKYIDSEIQPATLTK